MSDIKQEYTDKIESIAQDILYLKKKDNSFVLFRIIAFFAVFCLIYLVYYFKLFPLLYFVSFIPFLFVLSKHQKLIQEIAFLERKKKFYERGLARLANKWQLDTSSSTGEQFIDRNHLYSNDIELFGKGSLFHYLCQAQSYVGQKKLADILSLDSSKEEILQRQEAIKELQNTSIKEELASDCNDIASFDVEALHSWGDNSKVFNNKFIYIYHLISCVVTFVLLVSLFLPQGNVAYFIIFYIVQFFITYFLSDKVEKSVSSIDKIAFQLKLLSPALKVLENNKFESSKLRVYKDLENASSQIIYLANLLERFNNARYNLALHVFNVCGLLNVGQAYLIDKWRHRNGKKLAFWVDACATLESLNSLSVFAYENPEYIYPVITDDNTLVAKEMGHVLLDKEKRVCNSITIDNNQAIYLISGSNMAGKSTFLRTVAQNIVLAKAGCCVCAKEFATGVFSLACSIKIVDSFQDGISHFHAEVLRLRQILDLAKEKGENVLFFFDEILHGTNSSDRQVGSNAIIKKLLSNKAKGFVTTHDLALTSITETEKTVVNKHFSDEIINDEMLFDYIMKDGVVSKGNALYLLRSQGLDV